MPQRRKTKAAKSRPKPKMPDGETSGTMTKKQKKEKLERYKRDFNLHIELMKKRLEKECEDLCDMVEKCFMLELNQLPPALRNMTVEEYMENGFDGMVEKKEDNIKMTSARVNRTLSKVKRNRAAFNQIETIHEEDTLSTKKGKTKEVQFGGSTTVKLELPGSALQNSRYVTPSHKSALACGYDTPLITPRFDPRLPLTPAQGRAAQPGEVLVSLAGSPVFNPADNGKVRSGRDKRTIDIDNPDLKELEACTPDKVKKVLDMLSTVLKKTTAK